MTPEFDVVWNGVRDGKDSDLLVARPVPVKVPHAVRPRAPVPRMRRPAIKPTAVDRAGALKAALSTVVFMGQYDLARRAGISQTAAELLLRGWVRIGLVEVKHVHPEPRYRLAARGVFSCLRDQVAAVGGAGRAVR